MDKHFLEFWGNFLINAARGQKQIEEMSKWAEQGFTGFDELPEMFKKVYGLENLEKGTPDYAATWERALKDFSKSFKDYLDMMNMVPKDQHLSLIQKYEALKKKVAAQEETIAHLETLLYKKKIEAHGAVVENFMDLVEKQSKQFKETMDTFGRFLKSEDDKQ